MKKPYLFGLLSLALLFTGTTYAASDTGVDLDDYSSLARYCAETEVSDVETIQFQMGNPNMKVDGESVPIDPQQGDVTPLMIDQRTLLPARALVETLGGFISYDDGLVTIVGTDDTKIELTSGDPVMRVDGHEMVLDVAPVNTKNRTFLPVRAITETLGCEVDWNQSSSEVTVTQTCQTCRLVVLHDGILPETNPVEQLQIGDGAVVLVYSSVRETAEALELLEEQGIAAWPDEKIEAEVQGNHAGWEDDYCGFTKFSEQFHGERPITIAVIDSGIDGSISIFQNRLSGGYDFLNGRDGIPYDDNGHGTFVSGLIAKYTPDNVKFFPMKLCDSDGVCSYTSLIVSAFHYAQEQNVDVINMSMSIPARIPSIDLTVQKTVRQGIAVFCSAGNSAGDTAFFSPAGVPEAIVVAASDWNGRPADFSNYGSSVDLSCPGKDISGIGIGGRTVIQNGTSFASPLAAAAGAVLLTERDYSPQALEEKLQSFTEPFAHSSSKQYGDGILNLHQALEELEPEEPEDPEIPEEPEPVEPEPDSPSDSGEDVLYQYRWSHTRLNMDVGQSTSLHLYGCYRNAQRNWEVDVTENAKLISSDPSVVSVSGNTVKALKPGTVFLTFQIASLDGVRIPAPLEVTVNPAEEENILVERVVLTSTLLTLEPGEKSNINAVVLPYDATDSTVVWNSSDPSVATVKNGTITAVGRGDCEITASSGGKSAVCIVRVTQETADHFEIEIVSGPAEIQNGGSGDFVLEIETPIPYEAGSCPLILWCGLYNRSLTGNWVELQAQYYDGGCDTVTYHLDTSGLDLPDGTYTLNFALFYSAYYYVGASVTNTIDELRLN